MKMTTCGIYLVLVLVAIATGQVAIDRRGCGSHYEGTKGSINSPGFGVEEYPRLANCTWTIRVPEGQIVRIEFDSIDVEEDSGCAFDGVVIYDTTEGSAVADSAPFNDPIGGKAYCGNDELSPVYSSTNFVGVHFYSDEDTEGQGFNISWTAEVAHDGDQFNCTFEQGICRGWKDLASPADDFDWTLHHYRTPTSGTGPNSDHTLGNANGKYLFIEASAPRKENDTAMFASPTISFKEGEENMCIRFWYSMYGTATGTLFVSQTSGDENQVLWLQSGQQGVSWLQGEINLSYTPQPFHVTFVAIRGRGLYGDIAIDDISHESGRCSEVAPTDASPPTSVSSATTPRLVEPPFPVDVTCSTGFYKCISGDQCIPRIFLCDDFSDCPDSDDESGCSDLLGTTAVDPSVHGATNIPPKSCIFPDDFQCDDGTCLESWYRCDGTIHCVDATDERGCDVTGTANTLDVDLTTEDFADVDYTTDSTDYTWPPTVDGSTHRGSTTDSAVSTGAIRQSTTQAETTQLDEHTRAGAVVSSSSKQAVTIDSSMGKVSMTTGTTKSATLSSEGTDKPTEALTLDKATTEKMELAELGVSEEEIKTTSAMLTQTIVDDSQDATSAFTSSRTDMQFENAATAVSTIISTPKLPASTAGNGVYEKQTDKEQFIAQTASKDYEPAMGDGTTTKSPASSTSEGADEKNEVPAAFTPHTSPSDQGKREGKTTSSPGGSAATPRAIPPLALFLQSLVALLLVGWVAGAR